MTDLSLAAQAVLNAANGATSYGPDDCLNESRWVAAAALRAAADQVVPEFWHEDEDIYGWTMQDIRKKLFAIAAELEGAND
jgi:hypothetical protein